MGDRVGPGDAEGLTSASVTREEESGLQAEGTHSAQALDPQEGHARFCARFRTSDSWSPGLQVSVVWPPQSGAHQSFGIFSSLSLSLFLFLFYFCGTGN